MTVRQTVQVNFLLDVLDVSLQKKQHPRKRVTDLWIDKVNCMVASLIIKTKLNHLILRRFVYFCRIGKTLKSHNYEIFCINSVFFFENSVAQTTHFLNVLKDILIRNKFLTYYC